MVRLGTDERAILFTMHHVVSDGWSMQLLVAEVSALYGALEAGAEPALPPLPMQYGDFAVWQRGWLEGGVLDAQVAWWRSGWPARRPCWSCPRTGRGRRSPAPAPGARPSPCRRPPAAPCARWRRARGPRCSWRMLAAWQSLLGRYARTDDVSVGTPVAGRTREELEGLIGLFVNTLVLRTDLSGEPGFRALLGRVRETALGAFAHQDVTFEKLVEELAPERSLGHTPLFQVAFNFQNAAPGRAPFGKLVVEPLPPMVDAAPFDLNLHVAESGDALQVLLIYRAELFDHGTAERMLAHFATLLTAAAAGPDAPLAARAAGGRRGARRPRRPARLPSFRRTPPCTTCSPRRRRARRTRPR